jgi:UDPglucose 6-dehydrogenase
MTDTIKTAPIIGFAGLTHLGLCSSAAAAAKGCQVIGFDPDQIRIAAINALTPQVHEPDLIETLTAHQSAMRFSTDASALNACDLVYISTDVPTDDHGIADVTIVHHLITLVQPHLRSDCVLVVLCQVPPGFTRAINRPEPYLVYQVETLVFGQAMHRALRPERFIIGLSDGKARVPATLNAFLDRFDCPILPMTFESAELTKIAINCCLAASVSVANTLAELAEEIGADWREIVPALKLDRRIGPYAYLSSGLGLAGGNIERDLAAVINMGAEHGTHTRVIEAFVENSRHRAQWCLRALHDHVFSARHDAVIAFWGLT